MDGIDIQGNGLTVSLQRFNGPLEAGRDGGEGLGLTAAGGAYFQVGGADGGEDAELLVDPANNLIWVEVV